MELTGRLHAAAYPIDYLILAILGSVPLWPYSAGWGYGPSGGLGLVLIILLILVLAGRL